MSVNNQGISLAQQDPTRGITLKANGPANITAGTRGFVLSSSDFVNYNYGTTVTPNGNLGFTTNGVDGPGHTFYAPLLGASQGGNTAKRDEIKAYFDSHGLDTTNSTAYMFNVTWGTGTTPIGGVVLIGLWYQDPNAVYLNMGPVNTYDNAWQTSGQATYYGPPFSLAGTWNFPATFRLISPIISDGTQWC